jgi:hypothetical protein
MSTTPDTYLLIHNFFTKSSSAVAHVVFPTQIFQPKPTFLFILICYISILITLATSLSHQSNFILDSEYS